MGLCPPPADKYKWVSQYFAPPDTPTKVFPVSNEYVEQKNEVLFIWGPTEEENFIKYRQELCESPILKYPDFQKPFTITADAVYEYRPYIYGKKFTLVSYHEPWKWMKSVKDPGQRLIRWRLKLRDHEYNLIYKPGEINTNADILYRNPIYKASRMKVKMRRKRKVPGYCQYRHVKIGKA